MLCRLERLTKCFRIIVMFVTYFYGCWWLPAALSLVNADVVKLGKHKEQSEEDENDQVDI